MNLTSEDFINYFFANRNKSSSTIVPICVSPWISNSQSLGIQIINVHSNEYKESTSIASPRSKIIMNSLYDNQNKIYYKITNYANYSLLTKVYRNKNVWPIPAFFPNNYVDIAISDLYIFVGLDNNTINIIDKETGCLTFPQIYIISHITMLMVKDNFLICITSDGFLRIWKIFQDSCQIQSIMKQKIDFPSLDPITNIEITNELEDDSISPMIFFDNFIIRFSQSQNGWILTKRTTLKSMESQNSGIDQDLNSKSNSPPATMRLTTLYDVKKAFFNSLLFHETDNFIHCLTILLQKYAKYGQNECIFRLIKENLDLIKNGVKDYCGIDPKILLRKMIKIVSEFDSSFEQKIIELPEYKDTFNLKKNKINDNVNKSIEDYDEETFLWPIKKTEEKNLRNDAIEENSTIGANTKNNKIEDSKIKSKIETNSQVVKKCDQNIQSKKSHALPNSQVINQKKSKSKDINKDRINILTEMNNFIKLQNTQESSISHSNEKSNLNIKQIKSKFDVSDSELTSDDSD